MKFDAEKGMIQFVFANKDDYYLPSLICLDLKRYIYRLLRQQSYEGIYFVEEAEKGLRLSTLDGRSAQICKESTGQKWGRHIVRKLLGKDAGDTSFGVAGDEAWVLGMICRMMRIRRHLAFVFPVEIFDRLSGYGDIRKELAEEGSHFLKKQHLILIQAPANADVPRQYFAPAGSVFRTGLIPEIGHIYESGSGTPVYEKMVQKLGERICFFNRLEREDIHAMIQHFFLMKGRKMDPYLERGKDYGDFIWAWYHSERFKAAAGPVLPENEKRQMKCISDYLDKEPAFSRMDRSMAKLRRIYGEDTMAEMIRKYFPVETERIWIYSTDPILRKFRELKKSLCSRGESYMVQHDWGRPEDKEKMEAARHAIQMDLETIERELEKPRIGFSTDAGAMGKMHYMEMCMEAGRAAFRSGDMDTLERSVKALLYGVDRTDSIEETKTPQEENTDTLRKRCKCQDFHLDILKVSAALFEENDRKIRLRQDVEEKQEALFRLVEDVRSEKERYPGILEEIQKWQEDGARKLGMRAETLVLHMQKVKELQREIQSTRKLLIGSEKKIAGYRQALCQMEKILDCMAIRPPERVDQTLRHAGGELEKIMEEWWIV